MLVSEAPLNQRGFTLVEVLISIVVAMTILGGLMLSFVSQSGQYKYQNKRIDAVQDLEFSLKFIASDLRGALVGGETIDVSIGAAPEAAPTLGLRFKVWDISCSGCAANGVDGKVIRAYAYIAGATKSLRYDREGSTLSLIANSEILPNVTYFKVFEDTVTPRTGFSGIPDPLPQVNIPGPSGGSAAFNGYTILIEVEVEAGVKSGLLVDVRGNAVTTKRVWRYAQVYPMAAVP